MSDLNQTKLIRFEKDKVLFREGEQSREMYLIRSGRVKVYLSRKDKVIPLTNLGKGSVVGEMSFITGVPRSATVVVSEPVLANVITTDVLKEDNASISEWSLSIAKVLVERIRKTTSLIGDYLVAQKPQPPLEDNGKNRKEFSFEERPDSDSLRIYLKGYLKMDGVNILKTKIREEKLRKQRRIVLDFSEIIDIDNSGLSYLFELTQALKTGETEISVENVQLIRSKVLSIKGILNIISQVKAPMKRLEAGEVLIRQGSIEGSMYVVKTGSLSIYRTINGKEVVLSKAEAGDVVGEMSLIKEGRRSASVRADQASIVYVLDIQDFFKNIYNIPKWFMDIIQGLVERLRHTNLMLDTIIQNKRKKEKPNSWPHPLGIVIDSMNPGKFILHGEIIFDNLEYLSILVNSVREKGLQNIVLDLNKVKRIDQDSIVYLLHLTVELKRTGGFLTLLGPQKDIIKLKKQYDISK